jgi:histidinol-phosphate/aromatic aminotransferase/cobyric acid decarboxylase-like protein
MIDRLAVAGQGEGIDGLLGYLVRLLVEEGTPVVTSDGAYPTFNFHVRHIPASPVPSPRTRVAAHCTTLWSPPPPAPPLLLLTMVADLPLARAAAAHLSRRSFRLLQVAAQGGELHKVPFKGDREDPDALLAKAKEVDASLIYFSNPDNPMGSVNPASRVQSLIDNVPTGSLLCLDEAYVEFAPIAADGGGGGSSVAPPIDVSNVNVIRMRTFSKAYGLAGARWGQRRLFRTVFPFRNDV